jgi:hypothetical protein
MEPFFFDGHGRSLFGVYHPASGARARECAVILCYPMGREYLSALRAYRLLATGLSGSGFKSLTRGRTVSLITDWIGRVCP